MLKIIRTFKIRENIIHNDIDVIICENEGIPVSVFFIGRLDSSKRD
jgi:hypothetical protein